MNALLLSAVLAATPITLDQVRQESRNNLQGLLSELDRVRASEQTKLSRSVLFPQLSVQAQANRTITSSPKPTSGTARSGGRKIARLDGPLPGAATWNLTFRPAWPRRDSPLSRWTGSSTFSHRVMVFCL